MNSHWLIWVAAVQRGMLKEKIFQYKTKRWESRFPIYRPNNHPQHPTKLHFWYAPFLGSGHFQQCFSHVWPSFWKRVNPRIASIAAATYSFIDKESSLKFFIAIDGSFVLQLWRSRHFNPYRPLTNTSEVFWSNARTAHFSNFLLMPVSSLHASQFYISILIRDDCTHSSVTFYSKKLLVVGW